ncbi:MULTISPECIES: CPBP family intramembrane glutamic endopeptidase [unclassified Acidocella]|uniref:CPBP family intramembrane glutamic endopeptidase n=1 Tax=unclassified Acidocella TaxID=2648610 RepID=UPI00028CFFFA|nr:MULTISPECIES: CPBP family intramembrane glutamic endopeptidase [unclassified Acidocella]EKN00623.1 hypothetical protein MXAZACID_04462 [Acidocella sp. MX-AZ02]WBO60150.1 CPBP family intramembrane metalloprotease [Acidocella sp. MX-AZ03]
MRRALAALGWAALFAAIGAVLCFAAGDLAADPGHYPLKMQLYFLGLGAAEGLALGLLALCFGGLPGTRATGPAWLGPLRAIWLLLLAGLVMGLATLLPVLLPLDAGLLQSLHTGRVHLPDFHKPLSLMEIVISGELAVALWLVGALRRLGPALAQDGSPAGLAWRPARGQDYALALILALAVILLVLGIFHLLPPDPAKLQSLPSARMLSGPLWALPALLLAICVLAPIVEEILFRGILFAGLASRLGPVWAALLSSLLFAALHAPEKLHYPPGFVDVTLLALINCGLRLRLGSIRPGIALHIAYNTGLLLAAPLLH